MDQGDRKRKLDGLEVTECPYLDTIQRSLLDFDFEPMCSVSLQTGPNIYACLVCGKYFRGRGSQTPAYTHAVEEQHYCFVSLQEGTFWCLPDDYEIKDSSLHDIREALHPTFTKEQIQGLDNDAAVLNRDIFGRQYLCGFVGLNNLNKTDAVNAIVQALVHVTPLRDFFLRQTPAEATAKSKHPSAREVTIHFAELVRKIWSTRRFKATIDPHMLVQSISSASKKRFAIGTQAEIGELTAWLLNQLHLGVGGKLSKPRSSIIYKLFQGKVRVTTRQLKKKEKTMQEKVDDRLGSDDEAEDPEPMQEDEPEAKQEVEETVVVTNFLQLTLDIPDKPLFRDDDGGLVIPQEPLVNVLKKFDGVTFSDAINRQGEAQRKRYELVALPNYLVLHLARFRNKNSYSREKNPTIVAFPVKNLDLNEYIQRDGSAEEKLPATDDVRKMSIKEIKAFLTKHGRADILSSTIEEKELVEAAVDFCTKSLPDLLSHKYDLVANITHTSPSDVGREGKIDPLQEGSYKCHVQHPGTKQWYECQDLVVQEIMPQQIALSESYLLIFRGRRYEKS